MSRRCIRSAHYDRHDAQIHDTNECWIVNFNIQNSGAAINTGWSNIRYWKISNSRYWQKLNTKIAGNT